MSMPKILRCAAFCILVSPVAAQASPTVITFESLSDLDPVTSQFAGLGLTFTNTTALTAGISLNELDFPTHSGINAVFDDGSPISISFSLPVAAFGGFFTYVQPLTVTAFDASHLSLGSVTSAFGNNTVSGGDASSVPNEFLQLSFATGISSVTISGDPVGGSFVMDDVTVTPTATTSAVPEPGTLALVLVGFVGLARCLRARSVDNGLVRSDRIS